MMPNEFKVDVEVSDCEEFTFGSTQARVIEVQATLLGILHFILPLRISYLLEILCLLLGAGVYLKELRQ